MKIKLIIAALCLLMVSGNECKLYCGYWWNDAWIPGYVSQKSRFAELPEQVVGSALFYGPGVMEATMDYYGLDLSTAVDGVSLLTCAEIGQLVWLKRPDTPWEGPFLVSDCSERDDLYAHIYYRDEVVEVGFKTAVKWGMATTKPKAGKPYTVLQWRIDNVIVSRMPPYLLEGEPVEMADWFDSVLTYASPKDDRCRLVYHAPNSEWNDHQYPLWRVECVWMRFEPLYKQDAPCAAR